MNPERELSRNLRIALYSLVSAEAERRTAEMMEQSARESAILAAHRARAGKLISFAVGDRRFIARYCRETESLELEKVDTPLDHQQEKP